MAVIPARAGSKGLPHKNIKELRGHPLMAYSICASLKSKLINRVIVSTDSEEYAEIAKKYGAEVPFLRPTGISGDKATDYELFEHLIDFLQENEGELPDYFVHVRPTTPIRDWNVVDKAIEEFAATNDFNALRSIHEMSESAYKTFEIVDGLMVSVFKHDRDLEQSNRARQSFPPTYYANGYVDVLSVKYILESKKLHGNKVYPFVTKETMEVDNAFDFDIISSMCDQKYVDELFS